MRLPKVVNGGKLTPPPCIPNCVSTQVSIFSPNSLNVFLAVNDLYIWSANAWYPLEIKLFNLTY